MAALICSGAGGVCAAGAAMHPQGTIEGHRQSGVFDLDAIEVLARMGPFLVDVTQLQGVITAS